MPAYASNAVIKPSKRNFNAVKAAVQEVYAQTQHQFAISMLGGVVAAAMAILSAIMAAKAKTVAEVMATMSAHFATQTQLWAAQQAATYKALEKLT